MIGCKRKFKVGDVVRIREWDDMEREYGLDEGVINCRGVFIRSMRKLCGQEFTIEGISSSGAVRGLETVYVISTDMIELACVDQGEFNSDTSNIESYLSEFIKR